MDLYYELLKARQVELSPSFPQSMILRTHRALSWLQRAEQEEEDHDARFIFLWIAINALYARELPEHEDSPERKLYKEFLRQLVAADDNKMLDKLVAGNFKQSIARLIENRYVYRPFWEFQYGRVSEKQWRQWFISDSAKAKKALRDGDTQRVLAIALDRLYVLRNQIVHGSATWGSSVNRAQVESGAEILSFLVPAMISIVVEKYQLNWGVPSFPVVDIVKQ